MSVVLQRSPGQVSAVVEDDGRGFDAEAALAAAAAERRLGLLGMRERVALVGGTLTVESGARAGHDGHRPRPAAGRDGEAAR